MSGVIDPLTCYELCVQSPPHVVSMLRAIHRGSPTALREDFCGSATVSLCWLRESQAAGGMSRATGVDLDATALARARQAATAEGVEGGLSLLQADAVSDPVGLDQAADIIWVGNFSIGYIHERADLVAYLRRCRERLMLGRTESGGGVFVCDIYGGAGAFRLGSLTRTHLGPGREVVYYQWEHEAANPMTGMVRNAISFRVVVDREVVAQYPRAFVYDWRLWSLAELRTCMTDAGFVHIEFFKDLNAAPGEPARAVENPAELGEDWIVMVAARAQ